MQDILPLVYHHLDNRSRERFTVVCHNYAAAARVYNNEHWSTFIKLLDSDVQISAKNISAFVLRRLLNCTVLQVIHQLLLCDESSQCAACDTVTVVFKIDRPNNIQKVIYNNFALQDLVQCAIYCDDPENVLSKLVVSSAESCVYKLLRKYVGRPDVLPSGRSVEFAQTFRKPPRRNRWQISHEEVSSGTTCCSLAHIMVEGYNDPHNFNPLLYTAEIEYDSEPDSDYDD